MHLSFLWNLQGRENQQVLGKKASFKQFEPDRDPVLIPASNGENLTASFLQCHKCLVLDSLLRIQSNYEHIQTVLLLFSYQLCDDVKDFLFEWVKCNVAASAGSDGKDSLNRCHPLWPCCAAPQWWACSTWGSHE